MGKILVTGGTGTIGSHLVQVLKEHDVEFVAMVRNPAKATALAAQDINTVPGDFNDADSLRAAMAGVERLFLLTPPHDHQHIDSHRALQAARAQGVRHIIKVSAVGATKDGPVKLGHQHALAEEELQNSGIKYTILRPHSFLQNFLGSIPTIQQGQLYGTTGDQGIPFIDARDVADVAAEILINGGHENQTYTLTGPQQWSHAQLAEALSSAIGRAVTYINVPFEAAHGAMLEMGMPQWLADDLITLQKIWADGYGVEVSEATTEVLGRSGRTIYDFASDYADRFRG